ncbi:pilus assembly protein TadG-related protein [Aquidulcibacter sp.]|jgi:Flp pilus assembly protein TadG|uniref:pilus assembly protein TadG-related protein n=1 Tax=Aquidulcibacter sp. TaxID=2052990 RepID=UPI0037BF5290
MEKPKLLANLRLERRMARGSIAVVFALAALATILVVGMTVSYAEKLNLETKFQIALDSATLAAARLEDEDMDRTQIAERHFDSNLTTEERAMVTALEFKMTDDKDFDRVPRRGVTAAS